MLDGYESGPCASEIRHESKAYGEGSIITDPDSLNIVRSCPFTCVAQGGGSFSTQDAGGSRFLRQLKSQPRYSKSSFVYFLKPFFKCIYLFLILYVNIICYIHLVNHTKALVIIILNKRKCHEIRHKEEPLRPLNQQLVNNYETNSQK